MIGPAEIEEMMAEYAEAVAAGEEEALAKAPVWSVARSLDGLPAGAIPPEQLRTSLDEFTIRA